MAINKRLGEGGPFFFASEQPPTATAIDEDVYVTIAAVHPQFPGKVETIEIILSTDTAAQLIAALNGAVTVAAENAAACPSLGFVALRVLFGGRQSHAQTGAVVRGRTGEPMQVGDRGDETQSEPRSRRAGRGVGAIEGLEDLLQVGRRNARPVVRHRQRKALAGAHARYLDPHAGRRVTQRIVKDVGDHLRQQFLVASDGKRNIETRRERPALFPRGRLEGLDHFARDGGRGQGGETPPGALPLRPRRCAERRQTSRALL